MTCWRCSGESGFTIDPTAITFMFDLLVSAMLGDDDDNGGRHLVFTRGESDIFHVIYATDPTSKIWRFRYDGVTFRVTAGLPLQSFTGRDVAGRPLRRYCRNCQS